MNPEEQRANVVRYWWSKAEESWRLLSGSLQPEPTLLP